MLPEIDHHGIGYAEEILFGKKGVFDQERIAFIMDLSTLDLQAVPGSLKTTALLAKLLILEKHLPFRDGSGILVISHTNAAVNEITNRIGRFSPKLFSYPNFVGTIQRFVDQFLAIPFAHNYLGTALRWIDTESYQDQLSKQFHSIYSHQDFQEARRSLWARHYPDCLRAAKQDPKKAGQLCTERIYDELKNVFFNFLDQKIWTFGGKKPWLADPARKSYQTVKSVIYEVIKKEIISYEYAYNLASAYIQKAPVVKRLIQKRFKLVFIDEMQDMERHQYDLLESLFNSGNVVYQRVGDKNQAIYSGKISLEKIWVDREKVLFLEGSHRLSPKVAKMVNKFALDKNFSIEGRGECDLPPYMIVFSEDRICEVLSRFLELVREKIPEDVISRSRYPIKCIGWRKEGEDNNLGIKSYYPDFESKASSTRMFYPSLQSLVSSWRVSSSQKHPMNAARKTIVEAFISVLKQEETFQTDGRYFSITSMHKYLQEFDKEFCESFKLKVFLWSKALCQDSSDRVIDDIRCCLPDFLRRFGRKMEKSCSFVRSTDGVPVLRETLRRRKVPFPEENVYHCSRTGLQMKVGTVHSVKGETHLATLYLETFYRNKHESDRLPHCFCDEGNVFCSDYEKQTARVAYVAMSRPTHLLCFAIHQARYELIKDKLSGWKIIDLTATPSK